MATSPKRGHTETSLDAALLREVLKKQEQASEGAWEAASYVLTDTRVTLLATKPTDTVPLASISDEEHAATEAQLEALRKRGDRAPEPRCTSSSEIGADTTPLLPPHLSPQRALMAAARPSCDETRYASEFTKASPCENVRSVRSAAACGGGGDAASHQLGSRLAHFLLQASGGKSPFAKNAR